MLEHERPGITTEIPQLSHLIRWLTDLFKGKDLETAEEIFMTVLEELKKNKDALVAQAIADKHLPFRKGDRIEVIRQEEIATQRSKIRAALIKVSRKRQTSFHIAISEE